MNNYVKVDLQVYKSMIEILIAQPYANVASVMAKLNDGKSVEVVETPPATPEPTMAATGEV